MVVALKYPLSTEKAIRLIESDNIITFIVDKNATKSKIKQEMKEKFNAQVDSIRTQITKKGKKAYIKLKPETLAIDIATLLGIM